VPLAGALDILARLVARFGIVAVVSGRPVAFLTEHLGTGSPLDRLAIYGHYGLEHRAADGSVGRDPLVDDYQGAITKATRDARAAVPPGALVEEKGLALTLHWREAPEVAPRATELAHEIARRYGLAIRQGKRAIELVLPVAIDKGSVVISLLAGCSAGCVLGDDVGDLPAFAAIGALARSPGFSGVRVAVTGPEIPEALTKEADFTVEGPQGALGFLEELANRAAPANRAVD
jgi:trehalose 6-phosphate phosphatase